MDKWLNVSVDLVSKKTFSSSEDQITLICAFSRCGWQLTEEKKGMGEISHSPTHFN